MDKDKKQEVFIPFFNYLKLFSYFFVPEGFLISTIEY